MTLQLKTLLPLPEDLSYFPAPTKGKRAHNSNLGWGGPNTLFRFHWALYTGGTDIRTNLVYWTYTHLHF